MALTHPALGVHASQSGGRLPQAESKGVLRCLNHEPVEKKSGRPGDGAVGLDLVRTLCPTEDMDFVRVLKELVGAMEAKGLHYALIGGFAMSLRGVQRATADLDFILLLDDLATADTWLLGHGYQRVFRSENVSHYESADHAWGRIDILHAFRKPSLSMLQRAEAIEVESGFSIRVARSEDIIGLKVQALSNNPARAESDWHDIRLLVRAARATGSALDWDLIRDYFALFGREHELAALRDSDGQAE